MIRFVIVALCIFLNCLVFTSCSPNKSTNSVDNSGTSPYVTGKSYGVANGYPESWWSDVTPTADWEVLPASAKPGQVVLSKQTELGLLSNFAATPFVFKNKSYASLEGFWQATKFPEDENDERMANPSVKWPHTRSEVEQMTGFEAKRAGTKASELLKLLGIKWVTFERKKMQYEEQGESDFYLLIRSAMVAKVLQNDNVRKLLIKTKGLELVPDHKVEPSRPKAWHYYQIWMDIREEL